MIDFSIPLELEATRQRVIAFMDQYSYPRRQERQESREGKWMFGESIRGM
jgi:hypothetical protein